MIALESVIPKVKELLVAVPYFVGQSIIDDDGSTEKLNETEKALRDKGFCVIIGPIMRFPKRDNATTLSIVNAEIFIIVQINPPVNKVKAQRNIYEAVRSVVRALAAYTGTNPNDRFELAPEGGDLSSFDQGLWAYDLTFHKQAVF
jgi:hypothetical protein